MLDAAIATEPFAICISFGDPTSYATRVREAGIELICQVQDRQCALLAEGAGTTLPAAAIVRPSESTAEARLGALTRELL